MIRPRFRSVLLACVAALLVALALTLWLRQHPETFIAALNARLPPGITLGELRGLRVSAVGGRLQLLALDAGGARLRVEHASWFWRITGIWPLKVEPQWLTMRAISVGLAPPGPGTPENAALLPRFWLAAWWPLVARMSAASEQLRIDDSDGERLLEGRIEATDGGASGNATLRIGDFPPLALQWQPHPDTPRAWLLDWRGETAAAPSGTLLLQATAAGADWQLQAQAPALQAAGIALDGLQLAARGSSDLFEGSGALATATLELGGKAGTPRGEANWHCSGRLETTQSLRSTLQIAACDAGLDGATLAMDAPLTLALDAAFAPEQLDTAGGALQLRGLTQAAWTLEDLQLTLAQGTLWRAGAEALALPDTQIAAAIAHAGSASRAALHGRLTRLTANGAKRGAKLDGTLELRRGVDVLKALELDTTFDANPDTLRVKGTLSRARPGKLLAWQGAYSFADTGYRATLALDSTGWDWGKGLLRSLLGPKQTLVPGDLLAGELRATAGVRGTADHLRVTIDASARRIAGIVAGVGVAGLDCAPFTLTLEDGVIGAFAGMPCTVESVNAGITLDRLRATLRHDAPGWSLHDVAGELFGGRFDAATIGPLGAAPIDTSVSLRAIDLERIGKLLDDPELTLTGVLDGTIPLRIEGGTLTVRQGEMHSTAPGVIRYRPVTPPADESPQIALSRKALSNLEFDTLDATLDYAADGQLALAARIRGRNPDLDAKRPVHLNLTIETNLRTLLRSLTAGDRISEWLEQRT
ncbi:MAG: YdbH domain-containing protein [Pseudomonadales bacterium]|nr:YdbH domain-containing protein [Pseudomonadales bacterium]